MKRILFDIISLQGYHNGGEEYTRKVLGSLMCQQDVHIVGLYDSSIPFLDDDESEFKRRIKLEDVLKYRISDIVKRNMIDIFFIGIGQRFNKYNLKDINCRTICVIHDIGDIEFGYNRLHFLFPKSLKRYLCLTSDYWFKSSYFSLSSKIDRNYFNLRSFLKGTNVEIITVSEYTANSIKYYFPELESKPIRVFYPPTKNYTCKSAIENETLEKLIIDRSPFLLLLNINRVNKNTSFVINSFARLNHFFPNLKLLATGGVNKISTHNIYYLKYLSNSDIEYAYKNAWALVYPSFTEGFGYPPVEAMKYGTPVLSANVCSMPEILGDAVVYFSPFYEADLFCKMNLLEKDYEKYKILSWEKYDLIKAKQEKDLIALVNLILK